MRYISLTRDKIAMVDDEDYELISKYKWQAINIHGNWYASTTSHCILMHRLILGIVDPSIQVDHQNNDGLDNRKMNLRICNNQQNNANKPKQAGIHSSIYKGVSWNKVARKWHAYIKINYKRIHLGLFDDEIMAAKAYDRVAKEAFGEFAYLNFPSLTQ